MTPPHRKLFPPTNTNTQTLRHAVTLHNNVVVEQAKLL
jgi:hypothetical protein